MSIELGQSPRGFMPRGFCTCQLQPDRTRGPWPSPETSFRWARSEAAILPGLFKSVGLVGRPCRGIRDRRGLDAKRGKLRPRNVPFEGDLGWLGRRRWGANW